MDEGRHRPLFERIRERCRQESQRPELFSSFVQIAARERGAFEAPSGLPWPPASEEQLDATEAQLHFPLPQTLRALYSEVGNGGFGPGYGIVGAVGGAPHAGDWYQNVVEGYKQAKQYVDLSSIPEAKMQGEWFELPQRTWPRYLLPLCYWGCNTEHAISAQTGEMFAVVDGYYFANWASSLEDWLERWLNGTLEQE